MIYADIGILMKQARRNSGMSQNDLGELLHDARSKSWVSQVETGNILPSAPQIVEIVYLLGADPVQFLTLYLRDLYTPGVDPIAWGFGAEMIVERLAETGMVAGEMMGEDIQLWAMSKV